MYCELTLARNYGQKFGNKDFHFPHHSVLRIMSLASSTQQRDLLFGANESTTQLNLDVTLHSI